MDTPAPVFCIPYIISYSRGTGREGVIAREIVAFHPTLRFVLSLRLQREGGGVFLGHYGIRLCCEAVQVLVRAKFTVVSPVLTLGPSSWIEMLKLIFARNFPIAR